MAHFFEAPQTRLDVGKALEMVVLHHERAFLLRSEAAANSGQRIIQSLARHLLKILVAFHRGQAECELQLFLSPYLSNSLCLIWNILLKLFPDTDRIYQCAVHVESQGLAYCHYCSPSNNDYSIPYCKPNSLDGRYY